MTTKKELREIKEEIWKNVERKLEELRELGYIVDKNELFETTKSTIWCAIFNK